MQIFKKNLVAPTDRAWQARAAATSRRNGILVDSVNPVIFNVRA
jgi:hypothetical protein